MNIRLIETMEKEKAIRVSHVNKDNLLKIEIWDATGQPPQTLTISFDTFKLMIETMAMVRVK